MTKINDKSGNVLFECESDNVKECVAKALESGANLCEANLCGADLGGAYLRDADLGDANLRNANLCGANLGGAYLCGANLREADLCDANLRNADLYEADLCDANLGGAYLCGAYLGGANLCGANLCDANLRNANICNAYLGGANLRGANLCEADLGGAYLCGANLREANLCEADLCGAKYIPYIPFACPSDGEFTAWKKVEEKLVKLLIPADAHRSSATTNKCRCDKAMVVAITSLDGKEEYSETTIHTYKPLTYRVGEMVYPDEFDEDRWNECSNGIHFFINKQDAINY